MFARGVGREDVLPMGSQSMQQIIGSLKTPELHVLTVVLRQRQLALICPALLSSPLQMWAAVGSQSNLDGSVQIRRQTWTRS